MNLLGSEEDVLSLDRIRATLIRLEDTIIFCEEGFVVSVAQRQLD
jgi:hypothetical protein